MPGAALVGGSFPRSFLIPGTDTSIRVGGFASEILDYWFQNGQTNGSQNTTVGDNGQAALAAARCYRADRSRPPDQGQC